MSVLSYFSGVENIWLNKVINKLTNGVKFTDKKAKNGHVYIIGAGPGDAELITVKAQRLIQSADIILYDWLVSEDLLSTLPKKAQRVFVGKRAGKHSMSQANICDLLVKYAQQGLNVVRLKGGDPSIFARINEEADALTQNNISFAIVPGVTTACAASAYTGIPLTARDVARSVTFLTAQFADPKKLPNWQNYTFMQGKNNPTLVVYMGLSRLNELCKGLKSVGWPDNTSIALIENATTTNQKIITGSINDISNNESVATLMGPTLIIIGEVVNHTMNIDPALLVQHVNA
ncbi:uroporphyrinogen-III C-methyltransferase [Pseudoalteromonas sp. 13-15]|jgi:uroporphyrin-III C-methyltransferase|uniref:uroporphyrinogen-III C-methyltransferase n=1 Tax=Pseudoalteromonas marina TaxID=267375 RepID=A0ABT9FHD1_9GAMM|nr:MULTISPECIES: uroporphyrinogen-III C-methyltransferase [Pseudoalteromonas]MBL1385682.1 uroporphyrinogen-III C-methyltransferase [Colwellia sp.]AUL72571.1 uroporphyrinogen-III C-methyltransferase [Pseudoalteromonas sp. 13-15]MDP2566148.1 uroporphyrinogen-III C-methyltransferase [Pseudoalteromonas marina]UOB72351.1 uroporphyrinogen-III C-methyltransferase [Pseudoalteromonas sp. APM04]WFO20128.1 uroporphyrinogen-III C-methyltransferase [Pseudoalteromonas sp. H100]